MKDNIEERVNNSIMIHQQTIKQLRELKEKVHNNQDEQVRFRIETKHWYGYDTPHLLKNRSIVDLDEYTMKVVLDEAIKCENRRINKCIEILIERRKNEIQDK